MYIFRQRAVALSWRAVEAARPVRKIGVMARVFVLMTRLTERVARKIGRTVRKTGRAVREIVQVLWATELVSRVLGRAARLARSGVLARFCASCWNRRVGAI